MAKLVDVPTAATSVFELLGVKRTHEIAMQAPATNVASVFFGGMTEQPFELIPGASVETSVVSTKSIYVIGSSGDKVAIGVF